MGRTTARLAAGAATVAGVAAAGRAVQQLRAVAASRAAARVAEPGDWGLVAEDVALTSVVGSRLHGWWVPAGPDPAPAVLVVHGYASHAGDLLPVAPIVHAAGLHVLLLSVRGHGRSEPVDGQPRPPEFRQDVGTALDWLDARGDVTALGLLGHSMGGSVGLVVASDDARVAATVSVAGVADPTLSRIGWWPASLSRALLRLGARREDVDPRERFAVNRIAAVPGEVLLVHGEQDRVVPVGHAHALAAARPGVELLLVPDAGHSRFEAFAPAMGPARAFLAEHLHP